MADDRPAEVSRKFFVKEFGVTQDDTRLMMFFERNAVPMINSFITKGYSKDAIADGLITAVNMWRAKVTNKASVAQ